MKRKKEDGDQEDNVVITAADYNEITISESTEEPEFRDHSKKFCRKWTARFYCD